MNNTALSLHKLDTELDNNYCLPEWVIKININEFVKYQKLSRKHEEIFMNIPLLWEECINYFKTLDQSNKISFLNIFSCLKYEINSTDIENYDYIINYINKVIYPGLNRTEDIILQEFIKQSQLHFNDYICDTDIYNLTSIDEDKSWNILNLYFEKFDEKIQLFFQWDTKKIESFFKSIEWKNIFQENISIDNRSEESIYEFTSRYWDYEYSILTYKILNWESNNIEQLQEIESNSHWYHIYNSYLLLFLKKLQNNIWKDFFDIQELLWLWKWIYDQYQIYIKNNNLVTAHQLLYKYIYIRIFESIATLKMQDCLAISICSHYWYRAIKKLWWKENFDNLPIELQTRILEIHERTNIFSEININIFKFIEDHWYLFTEIIYNLVRIFDNSHIKKILDHQEYVFLISYMYSMIMYDENNLMYSNARVLKIWDIICWIIDNWENVYSILEYNEFDLNLLWWVLASKNFSKDNQFPQVDSIEDFNNQNNYFQLETLLAKSLIKSPENIDMLDENNYQNGFSKEYYIQICDWIKEAHIWSNLLEPILESFRKELYEWNANIIFLKDIKGQIKWICKLDISHNTKTWETKNYYWTHYLAHWLQWLGIWDLFKNILINTYVKSNKLECLVWIENIAWLSYHIEKCGGVWTWVIDVNWDFWLEIEQNYDKEFDTKNNRKRPGKYLDLENLAKINKDNVEIRFYSNYNEIKWNFLNDFWYLFDKWYKLTRSIKINKDFYVIIFENNQNNWKLIKSDIWKNFTVHETDNDSKVMIHHCLLTSITDEEYTFIINWTDLLTTSNTGDIQEALLNWLQNDIDLDIWKNQLQVFPQYYNNDISTIRILLDWFDNYDDLINYPNLSIYIENSCYSLNEIIRLYHNKEYKNDSILYKYWWIFDKIDILWNNVEYKWIWSKSLPLIKTIEDLKNEYEYIFAFSSKAPISWDDFYKLILDNQIDKIPYCDLDYWGLEWYIKRTLELIQIEKDSLI